MSSIFLGGASDLPSKDAAVKDSVIQPLRDCHISGPYDDWVYPDVSPYVPSPYYFLIRKLFSSPEQIHQLGSFRLHYKPPRDHASFDILRALIPFYHPGDSDLDTHRIDPRLWATLVQLYSNLPEEFLIYPIPLADQHLPLLQRIPSTDNFSLITVLELPRCKDLTDSSVLQLRNLNSLCALDVSETKLSSYGLKQLAGSLLWSSDHTPANRRGPWGLRILRLRGCQGIDKDVFLHLEKFPLLCVIDLRGTRCSSSSIPGHFRSFPDAQLHHPTPLTTSVSALRTRTSSFKLFSSTHVFILHVNSLVHPPRQLRTRPSIPALENPPKKRPRCPPSLLNEPSPAPLMSITSMSFSFAKTREEEDQIDSFDEVVSSEMYSEDDKRRVSDFYAPLRATDPLRPLVFRRSSRDTRQRYHASDYYAHHRRDQNDQRLMLYRDPPLWSLLGELASDVKPTGKREMSQSLVSKAALAESGRGKIDLLKRQAEGLLRARQEKRRKMDSSSGDPLIEAHSSRNPFRTLKYRGRTQGQSRHVPLLVPSKPLKPISNLAIPILSDAQLQELNRAAALERCPGSSKPKTNMGGKEKRVETYFSSAPAASTLSSLAKRKSMSSLESRIYSPSTNFAETAAVSGRTSLPIPNSFKRSPIDLQKSSNSITAAKRGETHTKKKSRQAAGGSACVESGKAFDWNGWAGN